MNAMLISGERNSHRIHRFAISRVYIAPSHSGLSRLGWWRTLDAAVLNFRVADPRGFRGSGFLISLALEC
jgi:hypothetical protein